MAAPILGPARFNSPIEWALAEADSLERHANQMEFYHDLGTPGVVICRARAKALRELVKLAKGDKA